jgi:purine-binding chemotaxis protein CheW
VIDGHHYAVLVDALEDVAPFALAPLTPGIALDNGWRAAGCGEVERDGEPILAINLAALVHGPAATMTVN